MRQATFSPEIWYKWKYNKFEKNHNDPGIWNGMDFFLIMHTYTFNKSLFLSTHIDFHLCTTYAHKWNGARAWLTLICKKHTQIPFPTEFGNNTHRRKWKRTGGFEIKKKRFCTFATKNYAHGDPADFISFGSTFGPWLRTVWVALKIKHGRDNRTNTCHLSAFRSQDAE